MTKAQQQLEQDISVNIGTDLFNAIFYFDECKTRRGTFNRLLRMDELQFQSKVASSKITCMLLIKWLEAVRERDKTFKETQYMTLKVHYSALCNYVYKL